jgi:CelD/BcsL family acetyltransferase involved in cellulose biosynthesis
MARRTAAEQFAGVSQEWQVLAERVDAPPFLYPGWINAWWRAFGTGELQVLTERADGDLRTVLPLVSHRGLLRSPCNWHSPEFGIVRASAGDGDQLLAELFGRGVPQVSLRFLPADGPALEDLRRAAAGAGYDVTTRNSARFPVVWLEDDWATYQKTRSRNLRGDLGRQRRRLSELGEVSLEVREDTELLSEAFRIEASGWKGREGTAIAAQPDTRQFYTEVAEWAHAQGWLRLVFLRVGERVLAFHFALEHDGAYLPLKGGFDIEFQRYSPGKLIIDATLRRAFEIGLRRYEFLAGDETYKLSWANGTRERSDFHGFAPGARGTLLRAADTHGRPLALRALALRRRSGKTRVG